VLTPVIGGGKMRAWVKKRAELHLVGFK